MTDSLARAVRYASGVVARALEERPDLDGLTTVTVPVVRGRAHAEVVRVDVPRDAAGRIDTDALIDRIALALERDREEHERREAAL